MPLPGRSAAKVCVEISVANAVAKSTLCRIVIPFFGRVIMPGVTGQVQSYLMNGRVSRPTGPVVYQRRLPRLRESRPTACVRRSRIMARITIPTPPTVASPISRRPIPRSTHLTQPADGNHRGDDHHRKGQHQRLVNARHNGRHRQR